MEVVMRVSRWSEEFYSKRSALLAEPDEQECNYRSTPQNNALVWTIRKQ